MVQIEIGASVTCYQNNIVCTKAAKLENWVQIFNPSESMDSTRMSGHERANEQGRSVRFHILSIGRFKTAA
jgi:hypothetical protein